MERAAGLNKGRGVNPGDTGRSARRACTVAGLNKGRGVNPGDTLHSPVVFLIGQHGSTKAGA